MAEETDEQPQPTPKRSHLRLVPSPEPTNTDSTNIPPTTGERRLRPRPVAAPNPGEIEKAREAGRAAIRAIVEEMFP